MTRSAEIAQKPARRWTGRRVFIPLALATAIGGFVTGIVGGPLFAPSGDAAGPGVVQMHAGTFPVATAGAAPQMVDANVSIRPDATAPDGPGPLRDAVLALLTEAAALPLLRDGRDSLADLERAVMSMAPVSAPWLVALDLEPAGPVQNAALATDAKDPAEAES